MINYGSSPAADEIEITLFGPGYGEAIAVHLGEGVWMLVDSCIDPESKEPASAVYLHQIGVDLSKVRSIIASHWHDDHVRGISKLAEMCPSADFFLSTVFNNQEAATFLAAYSGVSNPGQAKGTRELFDIIKNRVAPASPTAHRTMVLDATLNGQRVIVTALSPTPAAVNRFLAHMAQYLAEKDKPVNHVPELRPNLAAVSLHIDLGEDAVILGADLEEHTTCGWSAVLADSWSRVRRQATVYKVAHHGSQTGNCAELWTTLLEANPMACLTPFTRGSIRLPTDSDINRIKADTKHAYISSRASRRPKMDRNQLKRLGDICKNLSQTDAGFGAVRLRKKLGTSSWKAELFGNAQAL